MAIQMMFYPSTLGTIELMKMHSWYVIVITKLIISIKECRIVSEKKHTFCLVFVWLGFT